MKAVVTNAYFYKLDSKQWEMRQPYPPLGTLYAAAVVRQSGCEVALHDNNLSDDPNLLLQVLIKEKPQYLIIYDDGFNYLTKMCLTVMRDAAFAMQKLGNAMGCTVIVCSSDSSDHYELYINNGADIVIRGEGEVTLKELIERLQAGSDIDNIEGIAVKSAHGIRITQKRNVLKNLDELPFPAWDLINMEEYRAVWLSRYDHFYLNIATTRGCPYKCNWCAKPIYGNRYNSRSAHHVVQEIDYLHRHYGVDHFWMCDDIFGLKPGWVNEFNNQLGRSGLHIRYKIQSRADLLMEPGTVDTMVASGLDEVWLGAESGSQKVLDAMDKGITVNQIYSSTRLLKSKGVKVGFFIQLGYLGETADDIRQTIRMVLDLMPNMLGISVSYPLPGTAFYEKVRQELSVKSNWIDSADLDIMYRNTYPADYYRVLHSFLHRRFRAKKSRIEWVSRLTHWQMDFFVLFLKWGYHLLHATMMYVQLLWKIRRHRVIDRINLTA
jgi:anaerobic magnesium-protoporphyrin IX monomethyl ester cyclase